MFVIKWFMVEPLTGLLVHLKTSILLRQMSSPSKLLFHSERFTRSRKLRDQFGKITDTIFLAGNKSKILENDDFCANLYVLLNIICTKCIYITVYNKDCELYIARTWSMNQTISIEFGDPFEDETVKKNSRQFLEAYRIKEASFIEVR